MVEARAWEPYLVVSMPRPLLLVLALLLWTTPAMSMQITDPWPDPAAVRGVQEERVTFLSSDPFVPRDISRAPIRPINARLFLLGRHAQHEAARDRLTVSLLLRDFEHHASDWLWELDGKQNILYLSRGMAESIGRPVERLIGRNLRSLIDPQGKYEALSSGIRAPSPCGPPVHPVFTSQTRARCRAIRLPRKFA